jgi:thermostable 8-oxoguanine DNA glycosylase
MTPPVMEAFKMMRAHHVARQHGYWQALTPLTPNDRMRRWLFAFCSVHTTWENNVRGYLALRDLKWVRSKADLQQRLVASGVGLHNMRTTFIWEFKKKFLMAPDFFEHHAGESWPDTRHRICTNLRGLGYAKTSFALELVYPTQAEIVCLDVHMLRLYGCGDMNGRSGIRFQSLYLQMERDWVARCQGIGTSPYVARCVFWDRLQRKRSSRYWSHCLE